MDIKRDVTRIEPWLGASFDCECGKKHEVPIRKVEIGEQALQALASFCREQSWSSVALAADDHTWKAAGSKVRQLLEDEGIRVHVCLLAPDAHGELAADERAIVQLLLQLPEDAQAVLAVGSGTIHDIVRFVCHKTARAFVSVPTAASVDGFASVGAPLVLGGFKQTINAVAPVAIFADTAVLAAAPREMAAAGLGDMLGKYTSLADWQLGRILLDEHWCPVTAGMTKHAVDRAVELVPGVREGQPEALGGLMEALLLSGIAILLIGHSRPASGSEHHLSHFWEMRFLERNRKALLHGAKVGAATVLMAGRYEAVRSLPQAEALAQIAAARPLTAEETRADISRVYGAIAPQVLRENGLADGSAGSAPTAEQLAAAVSARWGDVLAAAEQVPPPEQVAAWLAAAHGPTTPGELGIEPALVEEALDYAQYVRSRFTVLRLGNWVLK